MKVCLVSAPTANDFTDRETAETEDVRAIAEHAPLGLLSLAAVLDEQRCPPEIVDLNRLYYDFLRADPPPPREIDFCRYASRMLAGRECDVLGFSTICSSYPLTLRIAREVKRANPEVTIVLGGPQASAVDLATLRSCPFVDVVVRGEGERILPMLVDVLCSGPALENVPGITYRRRDQVVQNPDAALILDLDTLPFPAFHLYPHIKTCTYLPLELGRGCPFECTFCSTSGFFRRRFRLKTPSRVVGEMHRGKEAYGIDNFDLVHDLFTVDRKRVVAFCEAVIRNGERFYWGCSARPDCIDDELIGLMARAGCRGVFFGIETGSARLQKVIKKRLDLAESSARIRICSKHKMKTAVSLITGFPDETIEDLRATVGFFMDSLRYDHADPQLCILAPLAGTPLHLEHKDRLIFDDVISDMSFQGWRQDPEDREMIARHPDLFPDFYSLPTPFLDRKFLKELREFLLDGVPRFRWLLVGLHQDSGNLLDVFDQWRAWRNGLRGPFPEGNPAIYYADASFHADFLGFVQKHYIPTRSRAPLPIGVLADYEAALSPGDGGSRYAQAEPGPQPAGDLGGLPARGRRPCLAPGVQVTTLGADYLKIVQCLRRKGRLGRVPVREVTLVTRATSEKRFEILQLSSLSAALLELCDGRRALPEIAAEFARRGLQVAGVPAEEACLVGLELLRRQGLIRLETPKPADVTDSEAGPQQYAAAGVIDGESIAPQDVVSDDAANPVCG